MYVCPNVASDAVKTFSQISEMPPATAVLTSTMFSFSSDVSHWKVFYLLLTHTQRLSTHKRAEFPG